MTKSKFAAAFAVLGLAAMLLFVGCNNAKVADNNSGNNNNNGNKTNKVKLPEAETVDLSTKTSLSLENYSYDIYCSIPDKSGAKWTADLTFDQDNIISDDESDDDFFGHFAYIFPTSGKGAGKVKLCVLDPTDNSTRTGKLIITYENGSKIEVALTQKGSADNAGIEGGASGRKKRGIGYGYNAFKGYASFRCIMNPVFQIAKMEEDDGITTEGGSEARIVYSDGESSIDYREESGSNIAELERSLNANVNLGLDFGAFSGELESNFDRKYKTDTNYQFAWLDTLVTRFAASIEGTNRTLASKDVLLPDAYASINNDPFKTVIKNYGTHVLVGGKMGGKLHVQMAADTSKIESSYDVSAMIKAGYQGMILTADGKVEGGYTETITKESSSFKFKVNVQGGSSGAEGTNASMDAMLTAREIDKSVIEGWTKSIAEIQNAVFIDFNDEDNLLPIYELVDREAEGGEDRYTEFKKYWETTMMTTSAFKPKKQSTYVTSAPAVITIPTEWLDDASLVKDVYLDGTMMARVANEFIPQLNKNKRVTVVYPASNDKIFYNMGYFIGDSTHKPHGVSWEGSKPVLNEKQREADKYGAVTTLYIKSLGMNARKPDYFDETTVFEDTTLKDYVFKAGKNKAGENTEYNVVKIFNHCYTRDYWNDNFWRDGTEYSTNTGDMRQWGLEGIPYYEDGWYAKSKDYNAHGGFSPSAEWNIPYGEYIGEIVTAMNNITGEKPDGTIAASFFKGGVLGLNLAKKTGYLTNDGLEHSDVSFLGLRAKSDDDYHENRLSLTESSGSAVYFSDSKNDIGYMYYWFPLIMSSDCK